MGTITQLIRRKRLSLKMNSGGVFMDTDIIQKVKEFLIERINPSFIILFGSYAKGTVHQDSDIDVSFYKEGFTISPYELFMLAQELADEIKVEVDLVNLESASTVFKAQIFADGEILYCADNDVLNAYRMVAFSMYAKLNEDRREILESIEESGVIYEK